MRSPPSAVAARTPESAVAWLTDENDARSGIVMTVHVPTPFAALPPSPCYAVIFASQRNGDDEAGYTRMADRMATLAASQPGYLGIETAR